MPIFTLMWKKDKVKAFFVQYVLLLFASEPQGELQPT